MNCLIENNNTNAFKIKIKRKNFTKNHFDKHECDDCFSATEQLFACPLCPCFIKDICYTCTFNLPKYQNLCKNCFNTVINNCKHDDISTFTYDPEILANKESIDFQYINCQNCGVSKAISKSNTKLLESIQSIKIDK